jgi:hypothetical protein
MVAFNQIVGRGSTGQVCLQVNMKTVNQAVDQEHLFLVGPCQRILDVIFFKDRHGVARKYFTMPLALEILPKSYLPAAFIFRADSNFINRIFPGIVNFKNKPAPGAFRFPVMSPNYGLAAKVQP